ncbi:MAG: 50S ribosomal protein L25/general stress protein Ctc [Mycobacteriales bacterium]
MAEVRISAEPRTEFGKGVARRTRKAGRVPAVLYGHGADPRHISLSARDFSHALKTDAGANVLLRLEIDGSSELALPKAIQRDPLRGDIEHVDLILVRLGETVTVEVAVNLVGVAPAESLVDLQLDTLSVQAEATHIPQHFDVDLTGLAVGDSVHAGDIKLPAGVELHADPEAVVVHLLPAPSAAQMEAEIAGVEAELGAGPAISTAATSTGEGAANAESGEGGPGASQ